MILVANQAVHRDIPEASLSHHLHKAAPHLTGPPPRSFAMLPIGLSKTHILRAGHPEPRPLLRVSLPNPFSHPNVAMTAGKAATQPYAKQTHRELVEGGEREC